MPFLITAAAVPIVTYLLWACSVVSGELKVLSVGDYLFVLYCVAHFVAPYLILRSTELTVLPLDFVHQRLDDCATCARFFLLGCQAGMLFTVVACTPNMDENRACFELYHSDD